MKDRAEMRKGAQQIIAQIGQVYIDILGGMRGPEQLSRWLNEETYLQVCNEHSLQHRIRQKNRLANQREFFDVKKAEIFPSKKNSIEAVILIKSPNTVRAISLRMDIIFDRWRVTHIELI